MEPQNKVQTQTTSDQKNAAQTGRSGAPLTNAPDIRKKKSATKEYLVGLALLVTLGAGFYYGIKYSNNETPLSHEKNLETSHDIAKSFLGLSPDEAEGSFKAQGNAAEDFSKVDEQNLPPKVQTHIKDVTAKIVDHLEDNPGTEGILSKCRIHGHDVHFIDRSGMILSHVREGEGLPANFERARDIIMLNKDKADLAIVIKKEDLEIYNQFGELQAKECLNCQKP